MTFTEILATIFNHHAHARRRIWSTKVFVGLEDSRLCIKGYSSSGPDDGKWHAWAVTESDYYADDWEVCE